MVKYSELIFQVLWLVVFMVVLWGMLAGHSLIPRWVHRNDKMAHFLVFGALAGMAHAAWPSLSFARIWILIVVLGLLAEGAQHLTVHHRFCWRDAVANGLGAAFMLGLLSVLG